MQEVVVNSVQSDFKKAKITYIDKGIKFNVSKLNTDHLEKLSDLSFMFRCNVEIKRSGTGLVVIITLP